MHRINTIPDIPELQRCHYIGDFVNAIDAEILLPLVTEIDDTPERPDRSGRKRRRLLQILVLFLYCRYPGITAPRSVEALSRKLNDLNGELGALLVFDKKPPSKNCLLKWFRRIDEVDPNLIKQALVDIGEMLPWVLPPPVEPKADGEAKRSSTRTKQTNRYIKRRENEALGNQEFEALFQDEAPEHSMEQGKCEELLLKWIHNNRLTCPDCKQDECTKRHEHGVSERSPTRTGRRQWRCRCCRSDLSVTSGTVLSSVKVPLKTALQCLYYMIRSRRGISAMQMAGYFNAPGSNMPVARILTLMHRIRAAMVEPSPIFEGTTEIDEAAIVLSDGSKAHLIGAYNHETRRVYIEVLDRKATKPMMRDFITRITAPGSRIYVDGDAAVPRTGPDRDTDRHYRAVNHSASKWGLHVTIGEDDVRGIFVTTNRIEGSWGFLKRSMRLRVSVSRHHLPLYLAEIMWRINYLGNRLESETFEGRERRELALIKQVVAGMVGKRLTEKQLRGPKTDPARRKARQLPLSPRGRAFPKPGRTEDAPAAVFGQSDAASEVKTHLARQLEFPLALGPQDGLASPVGPKSGGKAPEQLRGFAAPVELQCDHGILAEPKERKTA